MRICVQIVKFSENGALRIFLRLVGPLVRDLVIELEEGILDSIVRINEVSQAHEVGVIHVQEVVFDASLVRDVLLSSGALQNPWKLKSGLVPGEVLRDKDKLSVIDSLFGHLIWLKRLVQERCHPFLSELRLPQIDQVVAKLDDAGCAFLGICHLEHIRVVLLSYLCQNLEGVQIGTNFVEVARVKDGLDSVEVEVFEVSWFDVLTDVDSLHDHHLLCDVAGKFVLLSLGQAFLKGVSTLHDLSFINVETHVDALNFGMCIREPLKCFEKVFTPLRIFA